jgi:mRNA-degrading endonuclease RelE of RelBE toxin-antitoxin system
MIKISNQCGNQDKRYKIKFKPRSIKDLEKICKDDQKSIIDKIEKMIQKQEKKKTKIKLRLYRNV